MTRPRVHTYGDEQLKTLQRNTFKYFWKETNPRNGLIPDNTAVETPASIAGVGFALASYPIAVDRSYVTRARALARTLAVGRRPVPACRLAVGTKRRRNRVARLEAGKRL